MSAQPRDNDRSIRMPGSGGMDGFRRNLLEWFGRGARDYPWRRTTDPYAVLVSEAMLQQTQIATVLGRGYYERWMRAFPTWEALASASEEEVLKCWEGLGYYNRARHLRNTASIVVSEHGGEFPDDPARVLALPGVGRYTAGAVLSIAFGRRAGVVDGNVARVFSRIFAMEAPVNAPEGIRQLWEWAEGLVPENAPGAFNAALMELGQRICRPSTPDCGACPVRDSCRACAAGDPSRYPLKRRGPGITAKEERVVLADRDGRVFLAPEFGARRRGLWRLPELGKEDAADWDELFRFDYAITRYRVTLRVFAAPVSWMPEPGEGGWFDWRDAPALPPLGAPYRKALERHAEAGAAGDRLL
jgi:A/G-specific adenine glycosylase